MARPIVVLAEPDAHEADHLACPTSRLTPSTARNARVTALRYSSPRRSEVDENSKAVPPVALRDRRPRSPPLVAVGGHLVGDHGSQVRHGSQQLRAYWSGRE